MLKNPKKIDQKKNKVRGCEVNYRSQPHWHDRTEDHQVNKNNNNNNRLQYILI